MAGGRLNQAFARLRQRLRPADGPATSDRQLLDQFADGRDQEAFSRLVERHGPMVLRVCRRLLGDHHLAEDAFQATFLVLARKASSPFWSESIRGWLYEVACRTAGKARQARQRRQRREDVAAASRPAETQEQLIDDLRQVLDEELGRMPASYRWPILLCCLEDRTVDEAAAELGWSIGTVKGRLQRGREMLRDRLQRRGVGLSAGVLAAILAPTTAAPVALVQSTTQAALSGTLSALAKGVLQAMFLTKLKMTVMSLALLLVVGYGAGALWFHGAAAANAPVPDNIANPEAKPMLPASQPLLQDGLEVVVRATKVSFGPAESPVLEVVYTNRRDQALRLHDVGFELGHWMCKDARGPWKMVGPGEQEYSARPAPQVVEVGAGKSHIQKYVLAGPFQWQGFQSRPVAPIQFLTPGRCQVTAKIRFGAGRDDNNIPFWKGELTTHPVEIEIKADAQGAKPEADGFGAAVEGMASRITLPKEKFFVGEAIPVTYAVKNVSTEERTVWHSGFWPNHMILVHEAGGNEAVLTAGGLTVRQAFSPLGGRDKNAPMKLKPGEADSAWEKYDISKLSDVSKPGRYAVQYVYQEGEMKMLTSNVVSFEVVAR